MPIYFDEATRQLNEPHHANPGYSIPYPSGEAGLNVQRRTAQVDEALQSAQAQAEQERLAKQKLAEGGWESAATVAQIQGNAAIQAARMRYAAGGPVPSVRPGPANTRNYAKGGPVRR